MFTNIRKGKLQENKRSWIRSRKMEYVHLKTVGTVIKDVYVLIVSENVSARS